METEFNRLIGAIKSALDILLITHINPDGDACGSTLALYCALKDMGKRVYATCDGTLGNKYGFAVDAERFLNPLSIKDRFDLCIAMDCADMIRMGSARPLFESAHTTANIDHHVTNPLFADINIVEKASSTGELAYPVIKELGVELTSEICTLLYISLATDTGNFMYSCTTPASFSIMADICSRFDYERAARLLFGTRTLGDTMLIARTINSIQLFENGQIAVGSLTYEDMEGLPTAPDYETAITYLTSIDTVKIAVFLRQIAAGAFKLSLRSKGDIDVAAFAERYGGGGHKNASGARLNMPLGDCVAEIVGKAAELI